MRFEKKPQGFILKIEDEQLILSEHCTKPFDQMVESLPDDEPRYILYDFPMKNRVGLDDTRMLFLFWMPMESSVRLRMQYAGAKSLINTKFGGISVQLQEDDKSSLDYETIKSKMASRQGANYQQL
jgi:hypothetical protein